MNVNTKKSNKKIFISLLVLLLIISTAVAIYCNRDIFNNNRSNSSEYKKVNEVDYNKATEDQVYEGNKAKEDFLNQKESNSSDPQNDQKVNLLITNTNISESILQIRTMIDIKDDDGLCELSLNGPNGQVINKTSSTITQTTYSVCTGFDIDITGLISGKWTINIKYRGSFGVGDVVQEINI